MLVAQWYTTLRDSMDCDPPGSSVQGTSHAGILEPFPSPGDLPHPVIKPGFPALWADSLLSERTSDNHKSNLFFL